MLAHFISSSIERYESPDASLASGTVNLMVRKFAAFISWPSILMPGTNDYFSGYLIFLSGIFKSLR